MSDDYIPVYEYECRHKACPECGSTRGSTTYLGYLTHKVNGVPCYPADHLDENTSRCGTCGWTGLVHDRVPAKVKEGYRLVDVSRVTTPADPLCYIIKENVREIRSPQRPKD